MASSNSNADIDLGPSEIDDALYSKSGNLVRESTIKARRALLLFLAGFAVAIAMAAYERITFQREFRRVTDRIVAVERAAGAMRVADERLTMSANMAVASGDARWIDRYDSVLPEMDAALAEARALAPISIVEQLDRDTRDPNDRLVELETSAIAAVRGGDAATGRAILDSGPYQRDKANLQTGTDRFTESLAAEGRQAVKALSAWTTSALAIILVTAIVTMLVLWRQLAASLAQSEGAYLRAERLLKADTERDSFRAQLSDALEVADTEVQIHETIVHAMRLLAPNTPMEMLLSDSSNANLERAAEHPLAGAPGCGVETPFACAAVRRGNAVSFPSSEALNACARLRGRPIGTVTATCVPIMFMGRSLGVLHAARAAAEPLAPALNGQLEILGMLAGTRIGAVRAFAKTQLQASTDSLTGLANRRTLEDAARRLAANGKSFALVMGDLDRFKLMNDKHGHHAGDRALRQFAEVLRKSTREQDVAARWGGEEFALLFSDFDASRSHDVVERIRGTLAKVLHAAGSPPFTASFGIADSTMATSFEHIVRIADRALYASKQRQRDCATVGNPTDISSSGIHKTEQLDQVDVDLLNHILDKG